MNTAIFIFVVLVASGWLFYQIQKRIGEDQARHWKEFLNDNPHLFKKPDDKK